MGFKNDLTGKTFERLTVIGFSHSDSKWITHWRCRCKCGSEIVVRYNNLMSGNTRSCGCHKRDLLREKLTTHNLRKHPLYNVWSEMRQRCNNPRNINYHHYGGRGVKVCEEWNNDFQSFYDWAIANGYERGLTIDRIDTNGSYEPSNCRWTGMSVQKNNTRSNRFITYSGKTQTMADWARELGIDYRRLQTRIQLGWSMEKIVSVGNRKATINEIDRPLKYNKNKK